MACIEFTYDPATSIGSVRLLAGETDPTGLNAAGGDRTRTDAEIEALLAANDGDVRLAAAGLLETKAAEYAADATTITQGVLRQDFRERSRRMLEVAEALRAGIAPAPAFAEPSAPAAFGAGQAADPVEA
jgi:hypothetical protein